MRKLGKLMIGLWALALVVLFGSGYVNQYDDMKVTVLQVPDSTSKDLQCDTLDTAGFASTVIAYILGAPAGTADTLASDLKIEFELEEGTGNGSWTDVANASLTGYVTGTNTGTFGVGDSIVDMSTVYYQQYLGTKRYLRPVINATGDFTLGAKVTVVAIQTNSKYKPVTH